VQHIVLYGSANSYWFKDHSAIYFVYLWFIKINMEIYQRKSTIYIKVTAINKQYNSISILRLIAIALLLLFPVIIIYKTVRLYSCCCRLLVYNFYCSNAFPHNISVQKKSKFSNNQWNEIAYLKEINSFWKWANLLIFNILTPMI
jgi:hypothetical protein